MTNTLLFYKLSERLNDDLRLCAYMIDEANAHSVYKHLLKGHFDRYAIIFQEKLNSIDIDLSEWIQDTLLKIDFSRDELFMHDDFENLEI